MKRILTKRKYQFFPVRFLKGEKINLVVVDESIDIKENIWRNNDILPDRILGYTVDELEQMINFAKSRNFKFKIPMGSKDG